MSEQKQHGWADEPEGLVGGGKVMSLFEHLTELRQRLVISLVAVLVFFAIAMFFSSQLIIFLKQPLVAVLPKEANALHFTGPLDVFLTSIKVGFLTAIVAACPVWLYQFWRFIEPALYEKERKLILPFVLVSVLLFALGIAFSYYVILPLALEFLIGLGTEVGTPIITITDYVSMLMLMIFGFGFIFEAPLILVLLAILDLVSAKALIEARRYVIVGILVISAILTPPDPLSQIGMAVPLYLMYEIAILIIRFITRNRSR